jgi:ABC-type branched-subunit amino acid transport system permease subunit
VLGYAGSYALGFVILAMLAAFCWALLLARSPQPSDARQAYVKRNQS